jgi:4-hydroxy-3-methylbut-2-enyl diphosphate reductase
MELLIARSAGYCMGVRRAIDMALKVASEEGRLVYTYGPLIHNPQALEELRQKGVIPLHRDDPVPEAPVIVRAHGISTEVHERLGKVTERLVDATCPKVSRIQKRIQDYSSRGFAVVIAGDADHPEVVGLIGHAMGPAFVVSRPEDVDGLPELDRVVLVAQTTQDEAVFEEIRTRLVQRFPRAEALSTICESTHRRQAEVRDIAARVEALVVIGGRSSANTRRLAEIAASLGTRAYHVETAEELPLEELRGLERVGVTAGASTPSWIIEEVVRTLSEL